MGCCGSKTEDKTSAKVQALFANGLTGAPGVERAASCGCPGYISCGMQCYDKHSVVRVLDDTDARFAETVDVIARSLCGTATAAPDPVNDWVYAARTEKFGEPLPEAPTELRSAWFVWFTKFCMYWGLERGGVYALVDKGTGKVLGGAVTGPPNTTAMSEMGMCEYFRIGGKAGMSPPPNDSDGKLVKGRLAALDKVMKTAHKKVVGDKPHLYVLLFASDPEMQGKGCGAALLKFICELADADSVDTYLETGGKRNVGFYTKKGGFEVSERMPIVHDALTFDHSGGVCAMLRKPNTLAP